MIARSRPPQYVCGHSASELERLHLQGAFYEEITRRFFEAAGISRGMHVLDIGCGAGDVSFLAAELVGPSGSVLGVDRAPDALAAAVARAATLELTNVEFREAEIQAFPPDSPVDALVGRFVLMHQEDPADTLRQVVRHLRPGGIVAVLESHMSGSIAGVHSHPHSPTYDRILGWMVETIRAAGAHADMGLGLHKVFVDAGLPAPALWLQASVEGGPDAAIYRYVTESLRSMLPLAERWGIAALSADEIDELERRLREEVTTSGGVLVSPLTVGAWCRLP